MDTWYFNDKVTQDSCTLLASASNKILIINVLEDDQIPDERRPARSKSSLISDRTGRLTHDSLLLLCALTSTSRSTNVAASSFFCCCMLHAAFHRQATSQSTMATRSLATLVRRSVVSRRTIHATALHQGGASPPLPPFARNPPRSESVRDIGIWNHRSPIAVVHLNIRHQLTLFVHCPPSLPQ
jgi:hypothetical protein